MHKNQATVQKGQRPVSEALERASLHVGVGQGCRRQIGDLPGTKGVCTVLGTKLRKAASEGGETQTHKSPNFGQRRRKKGAQSGPNSCGRAVRVTCPFHSKCGWPRPFPV